MVVAQSGKEKFIYLVGAMEMDIQTEFMSLIHLIILGLDWLTCRNQNKLAAKLSMGFYIHLGAIMGLFQPVFMLMILSKIYG